MFFFGQIRPVFASYSNGFNQIGGISFESPGTNLAQLASSVCLKIFKRMFDAVRVQALVQLEDDPLRPRSPSNLGEIGFEMWNKHVKYLLKKIKSYEKVENRALVMPSQRMFKSHPFCVLINVQISLNV